MRMIRAIVLAVAAFAASGGAAWAHDARGAIKQELTAGSREINRALNTVPTADVETRSVLSNLRLWTIPRKLTICFVDGSSALRKRVSEAMRRLWPLEELSDGRLAYDAKSFETAGDCGPTPTAHIKVAFKAGDGHWSYVGIESLQYAPSMNFDGFTEQTPQTELDGIVGHEMGHALGLEHEHQSPAVPRDCGWNFDYIRANYQWASDQDMLFNFKQLEDFLQDGRHAYVFSAYDKRSIMHYSFPSKAFKEGSRSACFIEPNYAPSDQDRIAIRVAYGGSARTTQSLTRAAIPDIWRTRFSDPKFVKLQQLMDLKLKLLLD